MTHHSAVEYTILTKTVPQPGGVSLGRRSLRPLSAEEVLVRIGRAAVCGTDLHIINWNAWAAQRYRLPSVLGHEFSGVVLEVGGNVAEIAVGDKVAAETHLACGHCDQCLSDRGHTCLNLQVFSRLDCGAFAEYAIVPAALLRVLPSGLPHKYGCLLEPLGISLRAVMEANVTVGPLLIVGCGPIGLLAVAAARAIGIPEIVAMDLSSERLALAGAVGASLLINVRHDDVAAVLNGYADSGGVEAAIDTSGNQAGISTALSKVKPGGTLVLAGMPEKEVALDLTRHVILREVVLKGIYGRHLRETWEKAVELLPRLTAALDKIVTHEYRLEEFEKALAVATSGEAGKVQFVVDDTV